MTMEAHSNHTKTTVRLQDDYLEIERHGRFAKGSKRIPLRSIAAVQLKPPGMVTAGFMQLTIPGGREGVARTGGATLEAASDETSVLFVKKELAAFTQLRDAIQAAITESQRPAVPGAGSSTADELVKLAQLRDAGVLSEEEFAGQKARLLA